MTAYTDNMNQVATYWPPSGNDGFGNKTYGTSVQILCRWQDQAKMFRDAQGNETVSTAIVYVDRALAIGGIIALGANASAADAKEIRNYGCSPSLDAARELHKVWL